MSQKKENNCMRTTSVTVIRVVGSCFCEDGGGDGAEKICRPPSLVDGKKFKKSPG